MHVPQIFKLYDRGILIISGLWGLIFSGGCLLSEHTAKVCRRKVCRNRDELRTPNDLKGSEAGSGGTYSRFYLEAHGI